MVKQTQLALSDAAEWLGDWHPLAEQLGSADGLMSLGAVSAVLRLRPVRNPASLRSFLENYQRRILVPFELPAIESAHGHAARNGFAGTSAKSPSCPGNFLWSETMGRYVLLWLLGVPIPILFLIWAFGGLH